MANEKASRPAVLRSKEFLGRDVLDSGGSKVGTIRDLLLDRRRGTIRYIDVDLGVFRKQVIVPVHRVDWGEDAFVLRGLSGDQVKMLPPYDPQRPLTGEMLDELVWAYPRFYDHDETLAPMLPAGENRVIPISEAKDFRIPKGEPDIRNWTVFGSDGERVGTVADLLVDTAALKVAYLDVDLLDDLFKLGDDRHIVIPIGAADLRERGNDVWIRGLTAAEIGRLPAYLGGPLDPLVEERVTERFRSGPAAEERGTSG
jgi:sporulation protein YlmC with PRC-barrel domain